MAKKKTTKVAEATKNIEETVMATEHSHEELEAKVAELQEKVAQLESMHESDNSDKIVELAVAAVSDIVEAKVKTAVSNIKSGKVDIDFEELFQWFAKRRAKGRPFRK